MKMKLNYLTLFTLILIFFLAINFIAAENVDDELSSDDCLEMEVDEVISSSSDSFLENSTSNHPITNEEGSNDLLKTESTNHIYVSPDGSEDGTSEASPASFKYALDNLKDNTTVHMADGNYTLQISSSQTLQSNNVIIMANTFGKVMVTSTMNSAKDEFVIKGASNVTFKNVIFHSSPKVDSVFGIYGGEVVFENCSFINYKKIDSQLINVRKESKIYIENCNFINNTVGYSVIYQWDNQKAKTILNNCNFTNTKVLYGNSPDGSSFYIQSGSLDAIGSNFINDTSSYCVFLLTPNTSNNEKVEVNISSCTFRGNKANIVVKKGSTLIFENNTVDSEYAVELTGGNFNSPTTLTVLNNTQVTLAIGESVDVTFTLTDDKGNNIKVPKIKFKLDNVDKTVTYKNGVYSIEYTSMPVTERTPIYIDTIEPDYVNMVNLTLDMQIPPLVIKPSLNMSADDISDSIYGDYITAKVNISNLESGSLIYEFVNDNGFTKNVTDQFTNNVSTISLNDLPAGDYTLTVKYADDDFATSTVTKTFKVAKANSTIQGLNINLTIPVGDNITVQAVVPSTYTGNITYRLNNDNITVNVTDSAVFKGLANGTYTVYAKYNGDDNYNESEWFSTTFEVVKVDPVLNIAYSAPVINETVTVTVTMNKDISDNVTVIINNASPKDMKVVNGTLTFSFTPMYGEQNITVSFKGNDKYNEKTNTTIFPVSKLDANLTVGADSVSYGSPLVVNIATNEKFTGDITVYAGKYSQIAYITNGKGNATFADLPADTYLIIANFTETEIFKGEVKNTTAAVKGVEVPADKAFSTNVPANSKSPTFSIKLDKDATGNFTVSVDNGKIVKTVALKDGSASITVDNLAVGSHQVTVSYSGDGKYAPITQNTTVTIKEPAKPTPKVTKKKVKIVAKKKTFKAKKKVKKYTITLKSGKTLLKKVKVTLKVKGKTYKATTNKKGKATFKIKNLKKKGKYTAVIKFKGNKNYKAATKKVKITVKK